MVPISGSAYTYAYATLGELIAWIIGWDLIIEYAVGNVAVAISWSGYFQELLRVFGLAMAGLARHRLSKRGAGGGAGQIAGARPRSARRLGRRHRSRRGQAFAHAPHLFGIPLVFNLPAFADRRC